MVTQDWRSIQFFLSKSGVFEVQTDLETGALRCDCQAFRLKDICRHVRHVRARTDENGGTYPLKVSARVTEKEARNAQRSAEEFREFLLRYGKVEVV